MTKLLSKREVGGTPLLTVELPKGEVEALLGALDYLRAHVAPNAIEAITGAYPDEVASLYEDIRSWVKEHSSPLLVKESI